jgi:hypothetical protein
MVFQGDFDHFASDQRLGKVLLAPNADSSGPPHAEKPLFCSRSGFPSSSTSSRQEPKKGFLREFAGWLSGVKEKMVE